MYNNIQKYYPRFLFFAKVVILVFAYRLVTQRIIEENSYEFFLAQLLDVREWAPAVILTLLLFTTANWFVEVLKWQRLAQLIRPTTWVESLKQSLSSLTVSILTPNRIGEYGAKAMYFSKEERSRVVLYNFLGNFNQMATTVIFGCLGFLFIFREIKGLELVEISWIKMGMFTATVIIGLVLLSRMWKGFYAKMVLGLRTVPLRTHSEVFVLSLVKYLIFSHQFYFLLAFFGVDLGYLQCMGLLSLSYLISSLIPGFVLFDWLVKGSVAVAIFGRFGVDQMLVLSITSVMWLLNFGLPSVIGTFYVMGFKLTATPSEAAPEDAEKFLKRK